MWVKICANTSLADAQLAAALGADAVGFVFAPSKRQVTVEQVAAITPQLPDTVEKVGVFQEQDAGKLDAAARGAGLTAIQLHAAYRPELVQALNASLEAHIKLIQVIQVPVQGAGEVCLPELTAALCDPGLFAVLLDAAEAGASGGLGVAFSWEAFALPLRAARKQAAQWAEQNGTDVPKLLLAGGLNAGNVRQAVAALQPEGVDVASGVEAEPGYKSPAKLRAFLGAARNLLEPSS